MTAERLDHGWLYDGRFLCDGCNVRPNHEHRCFRGDATWADERQVCTCEECREADRLFGNVR